MIVDACLFAGEAEMLELRFRTLAAEVDRFVVVACTRTHQGEFVDEELIHQEYWRARTRAGIQKSWFRWVEPEMTLTRRGITYERPEGERGPARTRWYQHIEHQHRAGIRDAVLETCSPQADDLVMVSDVDEIPDPKVVKYLPGLVKTVGPVVLRQTFFSTRLCWSHPQGQWLGTTVSTARELAPQVARDNRAHLYAYPPDPTPGNVPAFAGAHLSWMGTDEERARKLDTFCHAELRGVFDPVEGRSLGRHPNGEELQPAPESWLASLPLPIRDGSFQVPESWR